MNENPIISEVVQGMRELFRLRVAAKRQMTVPQRLLNLLHLAEGDEIRIETEGAEIVSIQAFKMVPTAIFTPEVLNQLEKREAQLDCGGSGGGSPINPSRLVQEAKAKDPGGIARSSTA